MRGEGWLVAAGLAAFAGACAHTATQLAPTYDEPLHLVSGLTLWQLSDHRFSLEHGPMPQRALALPAWLAGAKLPPLEGEAWQQAGDTGFAFAQAFVLHSGAAFWPHLRAARFVNVAVAVALLATVWGWSRSLFGPREIPS